MEDNEVLRSVVLELDENGDLVEKMPPPEGVDKTDFKRIGKSFLRNLNRAMKTGESGEGKGDPLLKWGVKLVQAVTMTVVEEVQAAKTKKE
mgnify:CR=1 FL=1